MTNESGLLTINEAAQFLSVSKTTLRRWTNQGILKCYRIGNRAERRFAQSDLLEFIEGQGTSTDTVQPDSELPNSVDAHCSTYYRNAADQWTAIQPYLTNNLRSGGRTVYLYHSDYHRILCGLEREGVQPESLIESGNLAFLSTNDTYLRGGRFDKNRMIDFWAGTIDQARKDGIETLFLSCEMGWVNREIPGFESLSSYETELDQLITNSPSVTGVCQFPLEKFSGETIFDSICLHNKTTQSNGQSVIHP
jgi:excisionase family DNA binding protein